MAPDAQDLAIQIAVMNTNLENLTKALSNGAFKNVTDTIKESNALVVKAIEGLMEYHKERAIIEEKHRDETCKKLDKVTVTNKILIYVFSALTMGLILQSFGVIK